MEILCSDAKDELPTSALMLKEETVHYTSQ